MANALADDQVESIRSEYLSHRSIRATAKATGAARQTIRRLVVAEGLDASTASRSPPPAALVSGPGIDFPLLKKLFELGRPTEERLKFEEHVMALANEITSELGTAASALDTLRVETALSEYLSYRKFALKALTASEDYYRSAKEMARVVGTWSDIAKKSLDNFSRIIRDLEIKNRKRHHQSGNVFISSQQTAIVQTLGGSP